MAEFQYKIDIYPVKKKIEKLCRIESLNVIR